MPAGFRWSFTLARPPEPVHVCPMANEDLASAHVGEVHVNAQSSGMATQVLEDLFAFVDGELLAEGS